jgi:hypothetical protein
VFEGTGGQDVNNVRVSGFFTYTGFQKGFVERLGDIAELVKKERWVLGPAGEQAAVTAQYDALGQSLLDLYTREFVAAWRDALGKLQLRPLTTDKPKYIALGAAGAATSPIKQLLESIRDETALTRERAGSKPADNKAPAGGDATPTLLRQQGAAPGAAVEAAFKTFHVLVEGDATRRPIDGIIANLNEIHQSLTLLATNPSQAAVANASLQTQVASLRANAARLPAPFSDLMLKAAGTFEGDLTNSSRAQLARAVGDQVIGACNQIVPNRYPFTRGSNQEVPLADFGRLFGQGGVFDSFFKAEPDRAGRYLAAGMDLAPGQRACAHPFPRDVAGIPACGADPRRVLCDRRHHAVDQSGGHSAPRLRRHGGEARHQRHGGGKQAGLEFARRRSLAGPEPRTNGDHAGAGHHTAAAAAATAAAAAADVRRRSTATARLPPPARRRCWSEPVPGRCSACSMPPRRGARATGSS